MISDGRFYRVRGELSLKIHIIQRNWYDIITKRLTPTDIPLLSHDDCSIFHSRDIGACLS